MHPTNRAERHRERHLKGMRRVHEDRAQHAGLDGLGGRYQCACFEADGHGKRFAQFADHPQLCSSACCGNARQVSGPTLAERRNELVLSEERGALRQA